MTNPFLITQAMSSVVTLSALGFAQAAVDPTVLMMGAVSALAGTVVALWKSVSDAHKVTNRKLTDCESDREGLWRALADIEGCKSPEIMKTRYSGTVDTQP